MLSALLRRRVLSALLALLSSTLCMTARAADLTVSAASSLTNAFRDLGPAFAASHPGTTLVFNFGASDTLLAQIAKGAPADVFASADPHAMDRAEAQRLLAPGSRRNFVGNALVMITPADSSLAVKTLADVRRPEVKRVAIGNPASVPAGRYTKAALLAAGLWAVVESKAVFAQNVRQALDYVARGEVEAGFVYATDAAIVIGKDNDKAKVRIAAGVPTDTPITYPIAALAGSRNPDAAHKFLDFVLTPAAQAVLARHGFSRP